MRTVLYALVALVLARVHGESSGYCADRRCFTIHEDRTDFNSAQKACKERGGHLIIVRSEAANKVIADLLTARSGRFWIGLRSTPKQCPDPPPDLSGFIWITGDNTTNFVNWKTSDPECRQKCISVSKEELTWTQQYCSDVMEGYMCEIQNPMPCKPLNSESPVLYDTPFAFKTEDLSEIPMGSIATRRDLGTKHICLEGTWLLAPWSCEVYQGGCEQGCSTLNNHYVCSCRPGFKLQSNNVTCSPAHDESCLEVNAQHTSQCPDGHELAEDGKTCQDVDECHLKAQCQDENANCVNTQGGFLCQCKAGFIKVKDTCVDDDECAFAPCEHICNNTMGSYHCECHDGFSISSKDRNQCLPQCLDPECPALFCDYHNTNQCVCPVGFILEERQPDNYCVDIDECEDSYCDHNCTNNPGSFTCSCREGFYLIGDTKCEPLSFTTPRTEMYPGKTASFISDGGLLAIIVCCVLLVLLTVCITYHCMKRFGEITSFNLHKDCNQDMYDLQLVTTEKFTQKLPISNNNFT